MYLEQLIYDRTQADLDNDTDKAYISYSDLNRVESACAELAVLLNVTITTKTWVMSDYRYEDDMVRLRANLKTLQDAYYLAPGTPAIPPRITYTNYSQANDIEKIIHDIWMLYRQVQAGTQRLAFKLGTKLIGNREVN